MSSKKRVVVTGLGAVTPIGNNVPDFWSGLCEGRSGIAPITYFDTTDYTTKIAAEIKNINYEDHFERKDLKKIDLFTRFAMIASKEAFADAGLDRDKIDSFRFGVMIGSGMGGVWTIEEQLDVLWKKGAKRVSPFLIPKMIPNMASGMVSIALGLKGPNSAVCTACATATHAIGDSFKLIQRGDAVGMVCGGAESTITPLAIAGFMNMQALSSYNEEPTKASRPFDANRDGFVMGEGAGVLILEELEHAKARGARIYAEIVGYGLTGDAFHMTAPSPGGEGGARGMKMALDDAGIPPTEVQYVNAHGTSTPLNDKLETQAIKTVFGDHAYKLAISSNKSMIGHLIGAAGAAEAVATVKTVYENKIPCTLNYETPDPECDLDYVPNKMREAEVVYAISNSLGFGGHNTTICIKKYA
ncbi:MAG: beta-ketoacyl-ACP synthase II [Candidatus Sumerlaeaceae bacterium]|nr:beta-ketoacyl-ACP synthase II [Candidatus Sumerlaeaceae bacterium]